MSEDRDRMTENDEPETETQDVEAHKLNNGPGGLNSFGATDDDGDDVEAHKLNNGPGGLNSFGANDEGGDDVEAHKLY